MIPVALTIAGSDPSGGAGLQADLKTFHQHGVYGTAVVTLVTVQNTVRVSRVEVLSAELVREQLDAVLEDVPPAAAKTGALGDADVVGAVAARVSRLQVPLVVDPVMVSKHGAPLVDERARAAIVTELLPRAWLVTPNVPEAIALSGREIRDVGDAREAARAIAGLGARAVLVKGGHLAGPAVDVLFVDGRFELFEAPRIASAHTHGTGCTYSAAITAWLARGATLEQAIGRAKAWLTDAIRSPAGVGRGIGPVGHFAPLDLERER